MRGLEGKSIITMTKNIQIKKNKGLKIIIIIIKRNVTKKAHF